MKLLIITDLEGVSGIVDWDEHEKAGPEAKEYNQFLMTNEVNGAIEGALNGGAEEVWVAESHTIDIRQIHPDAYLLKVGKGIGVSPQCLGMQAGKWDAMAFIGNHSMADTPNGVLCHTQNLNIKSIYINNILVGEFGIQAAIAGTLGMPMIMVSGDEAACLQAKALLPDIEAAVVKYGTGRFSAWCITPAKAKKLIADKMEEALKKWQHIKPFVINGQIHFHEEYYNGMINEIIASDVIEAVNIRVERIFGKHK